MKPLALVGCLTAGAMALTFLSGAHPPSQPPPARLTQRLLCGCSTSACRRERRALAKQAALFFLQTDNDTIFLLESFNLDNLQPVGRVWTRKGAADYAYNPSSKSFVFNRLYFYTHHIDLVEKFDSATLLAEEVMLKQPKYQYVHGSRDVKATRLVKHGGRQECRSFIFTEVIPLKRD